MQRNLNELKISTTLRRVAIRRISLKCEKTKSEVQCSISKLVD